MLELERMTLQTIGGDVRMIRVMFLLVVKSDYDARILSDGNVGGLYQEVMGWRCMHILIEET